MRIMIQKRINVFKKENNDKKSGILGFNGVLMRKVGFLK